jgi:hypothetical protein
MLKHSKFSCWLIFTREAKEELARIEAYRIKLMARNKNLRDQAENAI